MNPSRWARVNELFARAVELQGEEREQCLASACGNDVALLDEVRSLLGADARAAGFLSQAPPALAEPAPVAVGAWRIVRELGRGGMGTVFLAERADGAFTMQAALKVLRRGLDTDALLARFRHERQILASLEHPHIARLLDGGATDDGRPWLAMEYIEGTTLLEACEGLSRSARLEVFRQLSHAVQFAHRNLVVHRDLKPGNVLVTRAGQVKLLDFGIAKVLGEGSAEHTRTGERVLTPAYASPEQVRGDRVTTAADVWALGVILYELFTARRPFAGSGTALATAILEHEPAPSGLDADLDAILFTALRKEPELRYSSVEALADDLARLETGLPVRARPATLGYRLGKFVRRHRLGLAAGTAAVLSLLTGAGVAAHQAYEARAARERAERSRARAEELVDFMLGDLRKKLEPTHRLDVLEDVTQAVRSYFDAVPSSETSPERRARLMQQLATVKLALSKADEAEALVKASRDVLAGAQPSDEVTLLEAAAANLQAQLHESRGELQAAHRAFEAARVALVALAARPSAAGDAHVQAMAASACDDVGRLLFTLGRPSEAVKAHLEAKQRLGPARVGEGREATAARGHNMMYLGRACEAQGALGEAEQALRETVALFRAAHTALPDDLELEDNLAIVLNDLGRVLRARGNPVEAEPLAVEALDFSRAALARDPENEVRIDGLAASHSFLGRAREQLGRLDGALEEFRADAALSRRLLARDEKSAYAKAALADALTNVGRVERKLGRLEPARAAHAEALAVREVLAEVDPTFHSEVALSKLELGRIVRLAKGDPSLLFQQALVALEPLAGDAAPAKLRGRYAQVLLELGQVERARPLIDSLRGSGAADPELLRLAEASGVISAPR